MGTDLTDAMNEGFNRLFDYISGANSESIAIEMTTPVLTYVEPGAGPNCNTTFTISFFTPTIYQTDTGPPLPNSNLIYIENIDIGNVGVREFAGFSNEKVIISQAAILENQIINSNEIDTDTSDNWFYAGYDPPFRLTNRHNEVWTRVVDSNKEKSNLKKYLRK